MTRPTTVEQAEAAAGNPAARTLPTYRRPRRAPRQPFTLLRHGNSTTVFHDLDRFVTERMARFITNKHGYRGRGYGMWVLRGNEYLGLHRLVGNVRHGPARKAVHAAR